MKKLLLILLVLFSSILTFAQPGGYVDGTWANWSFNSRVHGFYKAVGWNKDVDHILVFFGGDGQSTSNFATHDDVTPGSMLAAGQWDGITNLPGGGNRKWMIITLGNSGTTTIPGTDISFFFQNIVGGFDTSQHNRIHIGGLSGGPGRFWDYMRSALGDNNPYRTIFGTTISMSCASIFDDLNPVALGKKHYVWYGDPSGDGNAGTPYSTSVFLYNNCLSAITPNVDKRFKVTIGGNHSNNTWGIWNNTATCMNVTGTDTATNRWLWMIYAFGDPGVNVPPVANAGGDQLVVLPTTSTTLDGSSSSDVDGTITGYAWSKLTGPSGGTITSPTSVSTTITSLQQGVYTYRLLVTDNNGGTDDDTVQIVVTSGVPSNNLLSINTSNYFWPWTGREEPELLFDGLTNKKMDQNANVNFANPMKFAVELKDSVFENIKIRFYNGGSATQTWTIWLYDSSKILRGTYSLSNTGMVNSGYTIVPGNPDTIQTPIKWIHFECTNAASDVREIELYGDKVAKVSTLTPASVTPTILTDPGVGHFGFSSLGGQDTSYQKTASGKPLAKSYRSTSSQFTWNARDGVAYNLQPLTLNRFGDHGGWTLAFMKRYAVDVMFITTGASMGAKGADLGLTYSNTYTEMAPLNQYKDIIPGTDSTNTANWVNAGRSWKMLAYLWGNNPSATLPGNYTIESDVGVNVSAGQNLMQAIEVDNEPDKDWYGVTGYNSPEVLLAKLKNAYDSIRTVNPTIRIQLGALLGADTVRWKAMFFINYWKYGTPFPADGLNFNQYISSAYGGQPHSGFEDAISPEQFQIKEKVQKYADFRDRYFPGKQFRWTEVGYASSTSGSDYSVRGDLAGGDSTYQGALMIRTIERASCIPNGVTSIYNYWFNSDGSGTFGSMIMTRPRFHPVTFQYLYSDRLPIWWMYATRTNTMWDYKGWSTLLVDGDSTGVNVYRRDHNTDGNKKMYSIYKGTYSGSTTSNYVVNVGGTATAANLITYQFGDEDGVVTSLPIVGGNVTIPTVTEIPQYIQVEYNGAIPPIPSIQIYRRGSRRITINQ